MPLSSETRSAAVRARLKHPVIDSDGHTIEFAPAVNDYLKEIAGPQLLSRFGSVNDLAAAGGWHRQSWQERFDRRNIRPPWWAFPSANTLDRATTTLPKLLYQRMEQFGLDFAIVYPTLAMYAAHLRDNELRRAVSRAFNMYHADLFREFSDRMTPVAVIPMHTPEEAISELDFAVNELGMKVVMLPGNVRRPLPIVERRAPEAARFGFWVDNLAVDSLYDYDPVWAKCVDLGVAPTFHSSSMGWGSRNSISSYVYNHIGNFAAAGDAVCKALFLGGVIHRFPKLRCAFLEGGVGWACNLYSDLLGHWSKRNRHDVQNYNPARLNRELFRDLCRRYGTPLIQDRLHTLEAGERMTGPDEDSSMLDEFAACGMERPEDVRDVFMRNFYFGCEADDPMNAWAFNARVNPYAARLNAIFSSDIGHWDVPDMTEVTAEAYELVEHGLITEDDFRHFVFANPARLWASMNPDFFKGTAVGCEVQQLLAATE
jgi:predicted TIM-barrel fold metal-dependent hydrolase